jgi:hypothetical protein
MTILVLKPMVLWGTTIYGNPQMATRLRFVTFMRSGTIVKCLGGNPLKSGKCGNVFGGDTGHLMSQ